MSESTSERKLIKENIKNIKSLVKEIVFTPLYILASFVKDKVSICVWIYRYQRKALVVGYNSALRVVSVVHEHSMTVVLGALVNQCLWNGNLGNEVLSFSLF